MPGLDGTGGGRVVKRMARDQQILDDPAANEVFVNNPFERGRIAGAVPRSFGIDHGNGTTFANAKAVRLRAQNAALLRQSQLLQPAFQKVPCGQAAFFLAAFRVGLIAAQEDVPARHRHADADGSCMLRIRRLQVSSLKFEVSSFKSQVSSLNSER